jgi:TRAP-type C4-dicarboxylate transport system permease small subunit
MRRFLDGLHLALKVLIGLLVAVLIVPVTMQILSRYTGLIPRYIWTEEVARICFIWVIMLGAMVAVRDGTHFDVDLLPRSQNPRIEGAIRLFAHFVVLVTALIFVWYGWKFVEFGWYQTSEIAGLPMPWIFAAWPLAGVVWILFLGEKFADDIRMMRGEAA